MEDSVDILNNLVKCYEYFLEADKDVHKNPSFKNLMKHAETYKEYAKYRIAILNALSKSQNSPKLFTEEELVEQQNQDKYEPPDWLLDNRYLGC